jgi:xylan 1,4-beta-xylosidase
MVSAMGRLDALAYWTVSDHFEELGRGAELLHGGFGLLTVGNLRKPRWWALWMLEQLADRQVVADVDGDGAGDMVNAVASVDAGRRVATVVWNGTVDVTKSAGDPLLERRVTLSIAGLDRPSYSLRHRRLDEDHSNVNRTWGEIAAGRSWPSDDEWRQLAAGDELADYDEPRDVEPVDGVVTLEFDLPMPSVSLIELVPR